MAVEVGQAAPDFTLHDSDRQQRSLGEFKGKNVVLAFFPGAFTGGCTTEMCALRDSSDQFNNLNAQVLGISVDPIFSLKVFSEQNNLEFPAAERLQPADGQSVRRFHRELCRDGRVYRGQAGRICRG